MTLTDNSDSTPGQKSTAKTILLISQKLNVTAFTGKTLCLTGNTPRSNAVLLATLPGQTPFTGNILWSNTDLLAALPGQNAVLLAALPGQKLCITGNTPWSNTGLLAALPGQNAVLLAALPGQTQSPYC